MEQGKQPFASRIRIRLGTPRLAFVSPSLVFWGSPPPGYSYQIHSFVHTSQAIQKPQTTAAIVRGWLAGCVPTKVASPLRFPFLSFHFPPVIQKPTDAYSRCIPRQLRGWFSPPDFCLSRNGDPRVRIFFGAFGELALLRYLF